MNATSMPMLQKNQTTAVPTRMAAFRSDRAGDRIACRTSFRSGPPLHAGKLPQSRAELPRVPGMKHRLEPLSKVVHRQPALAIVALELSCSPVALGVAHQRRH